MTVLTKVVQGLMVAMGRPRSRARNAGRKEAAEAVEGVSKVVETASNPLSQVPGYSTPSDFAENVNFFKEMNQYFQASQGDLKALEELSNANNMPAVSQFVDVMKEMNQKVDEGYALLNSINNPTNGIQQQLDEAQNKLSEDQQALADCQASNAGGGSTGADA